MRVLDNGMAYQSPAPVQRTRHDGCAQSDRTREIVRRRRIDSRLLRGRRMASKQRIAFPPATVKQLLRGYRVGCLGSSEQRDSTDEHTTIEVLDCGLRLWCVWERLR